MPGRFMATLLCLAAGVLIFAGLWLLVRLPSMLYDAILNNDLIVFAEILLAVIVMLTLFSGGAKLLWRGIPALRGEEPLP